MNLMKRVAGSVTNAASSAASSAVKMGSDAASSAARGVSAGLSMASSGIAYAAGEVGKVGMIAYDTALQALPTQAQITALLDKVPIVR